MADEQKTEQPDDGRVGVTIDGRQLRVPKGTLVLDAATQAGIHIPIYCAHPKMDPVAVCRMCLVHIEKMPKLQPACAMQVTDGMVVTTRGPLVDKTREGVLEFLLFNHPLDCPVCDRGGECDLQDFAFRYGPPTSRMPITDKVHAKKGVPLSEHIELDQERCILCWRCTRYYDEITGEKEIVLSERGVHTVIETFNNEPLTSQYQGNLPEVCPVGALTHRQYRFESRPWDLQRTKSVCPECSYGCNINVDSRDFDIKRFASRDNPLVDDMWLCDRGRYSWPRWNVKRPEENGASRGTDRVRLVQLREGSALRMASLQEAVAAAAEALAGVKQKQGSGAIAVLGSPESTNEELWLLQRLARDVLGTGSVDHRFGPALAGLDPAEHALGIAEIEDCDAVVVLGAEPEANAPVLTLRLRKAETKVGVAIHRVDHDAAADDVAKLVAGRTRVGLVVDEENREHGAEVAAKLTGAGVRRLTITRGANGRGAKDMGMTPGLLPGYRKAAGGKGGLEILDAMEAGAVRALVVLNGAGLADEVEGERLARALRKAEVVVAIESRPSAFSENATVLIPGHSFFEKLGSVTNTEGRVQRIRPALPPATAVPPETRVLALLAEALGGADFPRGDALVVNRALLADVPAYRAAGNGGRALFDTVTA